MSLTLKPVIDELLASPYATRKSDEYIYVRCPICGDSQKHTDKAHCSIWIKPNQPLIYHCWICENTGIVNANFMRDLEITNPNVINTVALYNKATSKGSGKKQFMLPGVGSKLEVPSIQDTSRNREKLQYMCGRIGVNFTYKSLEYLRIIFSIKDFLAINNLTPNKSWEWGIGMLEKDYIGFLSMSKEYITFRSINPKNKFRYIKYAVYDKMSLSEQCYTIPMQVNPMEPEINLNICEGTFDLLGVFFNVMNANTTNNIYAAICGSGYKRVLQFFLKKGFMTNLNVNIYSDKDKNKWFYNNIFEMSPWFNEIHLYYNQFKGEKDWGVCRDKIVRRECVI